jgi:hypothetical protein
MFAEVSMTAGYRCCRLGRPRTVGGPAVGGRRSHHLSLPPEMIDMSLLGEVLDVDEPNVFAYSWGEETLRFDL